MVVSVWTAGDDEAADEHLHGLVVLVERGGAHLDAPLLGARLRLPHFEDLALDAQHVSGTRGLGPAEFLEARAEDAARGLHLAVDDEAHRERGGVPAARRESLEERAARRRFVEMIGLRIVLLRERLDGIGVDGDAAAGSVRLAGSEIFEKALDHARILRAGIGSPTAAR